MPEKFTEITDRDFWIKYWRDIRIPATVDCSFKNDRVIAQTIKRYIPEAIPGQWAIEIGCAPGKWLILFNKELHYRVAGYEYIDEAAQKTIENLISQNIDASQFRIVTGDFNKDMPEGSYDVALSLGFIEHFADINSIMLKQLSIVNKSGYLIFGVPNFRGVNYYLQRIIDRYLVHKLIPNHNLDAMDTNIYTDFANANRLKPVFIGYAGGFERGLFDVNSISNIPLRIFMKFIVRTFDLLFGNTKNKFFNGYILAIMQKP